MRGSVTITVLGESVVKATGELDAPDLPDKLAILDVMVHVLDLKLPDLIFYLGMFDDLHKSVKIVDCTEIDNLDDVKIDWVELGKQIREGSSDAGSEKE